MAERCSIHLVMSAAAAARAAAFGASGDVVVWMHDAVALALADARAPTLAEGVREHVLREELQARGLADLPLRPDVVVIGYAELVALCAADCAVPVSWGGG